MSVKALFSSDSIVVVFGIKDGSGWAHPMKRRGISQYGRFAAQEAAPAHNLQLKQLCFPVRILTPALTAQTRFSSVKA